MQQTNMDLQAAANWVVTLACAYRCPYCTIPARAKSDYGGLTVDLEAAARRFDETGLSWMIHISGGEPFLIPGFARACKRLTARHRISINTNLSCSVDDLCDRVDPEKVAFVHCSLHVTQKMGGDMDAFVRKVLQLKEHNFNTFVTQVMWPPLFDGFDDLFSRLHQQGITVRPKAFRGQHRGRHFPGAYTTEQRDRIVSYIDRSAALDSGVDMSDALINPTQDREFIDGDLSFKGQYCSAGMNFVYIDHKGTIQRCPSEAPFLGNIYGEGIRLLDRPLRCTSSSCGCPYFGLRFASTRPTLITGTGYDWARPLVEAPLRKLGLKEAAKNAWMIYKERTSASPPGS